MTIIKTRNDTAANFTSANTLLAAGERAIESDTLKEKVGPGYWNDLDYMPTGTSDGGTGVPESISYSSTVPLDTAGNGKAMAQHVLDADDVFSVGASPTEFGNCAFSLVGDGSHEPDFSAFVSANGYTYSSTANDNNIYSLVYVYGSAMLYGSLGATADLTPPTLVSATVPDSDPTRINLVWSKSINSTVSAAAAFAVSSGHTLTAHTYDTSTTSHLTTSTPFVGGETKTLAYTQPVSNKMQDLAGNLLASFSGTSITDSVSTPTLVSAIVSNSTPGRIDLTWSEAMNSTISASAAFAVSSGHPLTAHTYVDSTHTYLTTSSDFAASETKTLAYTQPGSNLMKDSAGGNLVASFSGTAITDNVSGVSGSIVVTVTESPSPIDLTTSGYADWIMDDSFATFQRRKGVNSGGTPFPTGIITVADVNLTYPGWSHAGTQNTCDAGDSSQGSGSFTSAAYGHDAVVAGDAKLQFSAPATTTTRHLDVWFEPDTTNDMTLRVTLSDGSASPQVISIPARGSETARKASIAYNSSSSGTITASLETGAGLSSASFFLFECVGYKTS